MTDTSHKDTNGIRIPFIGEPAPAFTAETTNGTIDFPGDYKGKWVILFSHPADFTPVCTTEFMTLASMQPEFDELNAKLIGLSVDSSYSHIAWLRTIKERIKYRGMENVEVRFPVIADVNKEVAAKYGMIHPEVSDTYPVRSMFIIDPEGRIKATLIYPQPTGRNFQELKRMLIACQTAAVHQVATPADWQPGDDVIVPPPDQYGLARQRTEKTVEALRCEDWFLCFKTLGDSGDRRAGI